MITGDIQVCILQFWDCGVSIVYILLDTVVSSCAFIRLDLGTIIFTILYS